MRKQFQLICCCKNPPDVKEWSERACQNHTFTWFIDKCTSFSGWSEDCCISPNLFVKLSTALQQFVAFSGFMSTMLGLFEYIGEVSRDMTSLSSSHNGWLPKKILGCLLSKLWTIVYLSIPTGNESTSQSPLCGLKNDSSESPSIPNQFSALWIFIKSRTNSSSVLPPISPPRPLSGPNTSWLYKGSFATG